MLTFDPEHHEYTWNGVAVPHVTAVLKPLTDYSMVPPDKLEAARQKGVAVHAMVEHDCKGTLGDLPEWMVPVYDYWLRVKKDMGLEIIKSERQVFHPVYGYAGTLDLECIATKTKLKGVGIIDVKRSFFGGKAIGLQTAAYAGACDHGKKKQSDRVQWRAALRLREDMKPAFQYYDDRADFSVFAALLTVHNWRKIHE